MIAVLYDVHANLAALEAVLEDAEARGVTRYALGGDYAALGLWPVETLRRLRELDTVAMIRGNHERWLVDRSDVPSMPGLGEAIEEEAAAVGPAECERLHALPATASLEGALLCHGTPHSDVVEISASPQADDDALAGPRIFCGHSHLQFRRRSRDGRVEIINPGSVGLPMDGDRRPAYALLGDDGEVELRRVAYDHEAYARALADHAGWGRGIAAALERGSWSP